MLPKILAIAACLGVLLGAAQWTLSSGEVGTGVGLYAAILVAMAGLLVIALRGRWISRHLHAFSLGGLLAGSLGALAYGLFLQHPLTLYVPSMIGYAAVGILLGIVLARALLIRLSVDECTLTAALCWAVIGALFGAGLTYDRTLDLLWTIGAGLLGGVAGTVCGPLMYDPKFGRRD